jgi:nucleoside-diphosphate-sugar epimerase
MVILVTGAFGNVGSHVISILRELNYSIRCFDIDTPQNRKKAKRVTKFAEIIWGNLCDAEAVRKAMQGVDAVLHLAAIIPPVSEKKTKLAWDVNVCGTRNIIEAIQAQPNMPKLIFTSSISVFGHTQLLEPPRRITDPLNPTDNYSKTKVTCEEMIHQSSIPFVICRLAAASPVELSNFDPIMFDIPLNTRIEFVHPRDVALALVNAISCEAVIGKTLLIGGGPSCQMFYRDFVSRILDAFGVGKLPEKAFQTSGHFYTDWLDTRESQKLLQYQNTSFESYAQELGHRMRHLHIIIESLRNFIRPWLLSKSPYLRKVKAKKIPITAT